MPIEYSLHDRVAMKKQHPCGANDWEIIFVGADIKIKCQNCGRIVMLTRADFNKSVRKILIKYSSETE